MTIREDEFRAVLKAFPGDPGVHKGRYREYALRSADAGNGRKYSVAILRQVEQGNGEAQEAARDLLDDLQPSLLLIVGIAGGVPSDDITLGDVVLATRILDFSIEARKFEGETTYNVGGGAISKSIAAGVANLGAREVDLGEWWSDLPEKPHVSSGPGKVYGPQDWQRKVRESLRAHAAPRPPQFYAGVIAASDRLVKDPKLLIPWLKTARGILAVEMESAGVHRATHERTPMLSIRGLSDIVGLKRHDAWTKYACSSAAAFAAAYLRTQPVDIKRLVEGAQSTQEDADRIEESFANIIPLRHFPEPLYVAPAHATTKAAMWALLNANAPQVKDFIPNAWTVHDKMFYGFVDPERSRLKTVVDIGAVEQLDAKEWAFSQDPNWRRLFVQLLNGALSDDLSAQGVRYFKDQDHYAFLGWPDEPDRTLKYQNLKVRSTVTVVMHYERTSQTGKKYTYQRHNAFQGRFRLLGGDWYLEITPTYRFTFDGKRLTGSHESLLSGIKRLERNRSVLSQILQWQAVLRAPWHRVGSARLLEFAPLISLPFHSAVSEGSLTALDAPPQAAVIDGEVEE